MAFHIRNPETDRLARKVASLKGTGLTEAVHTALENELARQQPEENLVGKVLQFVREVRQRSHPELGLPADKAWRDSLYERD